MNCHTMFNSSSSFRLLSSLPGRQRWRVPGLRNSAALARRLEPAFSRQTGIRHALANHVSGSLLLEYDAAAHDEQSMYTLLVTVLAEETQQLGAPKAPAALAKPGSAGDAAQALLCARVGIPAARLRRARNMSILNVVVDLLPSFGLVEIINAARNKGSRLLLLLGVRSVPAQLVLLGLANVALFGAALYVTRQRKQVWRRLAADVTERVQVSTFDHIQRMDMRSLDSHNQGRLTKLVLEDSERIKDHLARSSPELIRRGVFGVSLMGILFSLAPALGVMSFAPLPVIVLSALVYGAPLKKKYARVHQDAGQLNHLISNNLSSIVTIKSYATELYERDRVQKSVAAVVSSEEDSFRATMKFADVGQLLFFSGWVASLTVGGLLLRKNALSQNAFSTLIYMIPQLVESFYGIDELFDNRQKATEAAQRVLALLNEPITLVDGTKALPEHGLEREIRFSDVTFGYDEREAVLRGLDLTIPAHQITAIVGGTGSGKSTILKLLMRLYELDSGSITVDGTELRDLAVHGLRRAIGYVSQEVYLFNGTIWENLTYGHPSATLAEVRRAAQLAEAASFIEALPQGYDTVVGDYGAKLSGGQRQRISIARAILDQPRILLLDEATSAVDNETEVAIQRAIQRVSVGRTTVIVAHRLSTIRHAHTILVMKDGRIAERGSHDELLRLEGAYAAMWKVQTGESISSTTGDAAANDADETVEGTQSDRLHRDSTLSRTIYASGREH